MVRKMRILYVVGIGLLVLASAATAQEEQWLQYHSAREFGLLGGGMQPQMLDISTEKPSGVNVPQFKSARPLFAKWSSLMAKSGHLWAALDRTHKQGPYDLLYIDSNGNGQLADETAVAAYRIDQYGAYFGPVKVIFEIEDGPVTYHLNFSSHARDEQSRRLYVSSGGWYQGDITLDGQKKHCILFDYNANGTFNDKSADAAQCDRVWIGAVVGGQDTPSGGNSFFPESRNLYQQSVLVIRETGQGTRFVGNYIEVDRVLYRPEIARDGACIKLIRAEDVKFGTVRLPGFVTQVSANGENGLFVRKPEKGVASLPVGQYRIYDWIIDRQDDKGTPWRLQGSGNAAKDAFDVTEGNQTALSVGEPLVATLDESADKGTHSFRHILQGRDGERVELTRNGERPQAPKVRIRSADGKYDRTYSFSYG